MPCLASSAPLRREFGIRVPGHLEFRTIMSRRLSVLGGVHDGEGAAARQHRRRREHLCTTTVVSCDALRGGTDAVFLVHAWGTQPDAEQAGRNGRRPATGDGIRVVDTRVNNRDGCTMKGVGVFRTRLVVAASPPIRRFRPVVRSRRERRRDAAIDSALPRSSSCAAPVHAAVEVDTEGALRRLLPGSMVAPFTRSGIRAPGSTGCADDPVGPHRACRLRPRRLGGAGTAAVGRGRTNGPARRLPFPWVQHDVRLRQRRRQDRPSCDTGRHGCRVRAVVVDGGRAGPRIGSAAMNAVVPPRLSCRRCEPDARGLVPAAAAHRSPAGRARMERIWPISALQDRSNES